MNTSVNILFFSKHCTMCQQLINILQREQLIQYFKLFCVDNRLDQLPVSIEIVPTMIVTDHNGPIEGIEAACEWIRRVKFIRNQSQQSSTNLVNQTLQTLRKKTGPQSYIQSEMGGFSDSFAFTNKDKALSHNFVEAGKEDKQAIFTAPEQGAISKREQDNKIQEMKEVRDNMDNEFEKNARVQQINAVMKYEQEQQQTVSSSNMTKAQRRKKEREERDQMNRMKQMQHNYMMHSQNMNMYNR